MEKQKKQKWYNDGLSALFQKCLTPFYVLSKFFFKRSIIMVACMSCDDGEDVKKYKNTHDYVRCRTLGLLADIFRNNNRGKDYKIAELGVFRGDFAARIQNEFQDEQLYLFDTFDGFPTEDKALDIQKKFSKDSFEVSDFESTSVQLVLSKMKFPDNCHICKGKFPLSVTDEHKQIKWGLVSLDVDLYQPTLEGLRFFYPSLLPGGFIMVHDYNNLEYAGVKKAVEDFENEVSYLHKIPIPDSRGSLIIVK
ncbi:MAG: TylF/MycF family methyltransferase [Synergistaceae bacterium]|jgi:O-methyltransferase|nr:TylF/MycF family methyltransferase [Synergistaceae bacterium]